MTTLHVAEFESPVGSMRVVSSDAGLAYLELPHANGRGLRGWHRRNFPDAELAPAYKPNRAAIKQVLEFLEDKREEFDLPLDLRGTPFQLKVWKALLEIPYGEKRSYADVAKTVRRPKAVRAVGAANGSNPVPLVVPCHRVIASDGTLGGYGGGLELKARLLAMEGSHPHEGQLL